MAAPYVIVVLAGDSNCGSGDFADAAYDVTNNHVFQLKRDLKTVQVAPAFLDNQGMGATQVGSTVALCNLLDLRGHRPPGYDILICPMGLAGTAFLNYWATTGTRYALDGGKGISPGLYGMVNAALALDSRNRIWFFDWNHGYNETGPAGTQYAYTANMIATWGEIRSTVATAARAPLLVTGGPPDFYNIVHLAPLGVIAAQIDSPNYLDSCAYVDPTDRVSMVGAYPPTAAIVAASGGPTILHSYHPNNNYIHFCAAAHRGGIDNSPSNVGENVLYPLSERKYTALLKLGWRMRASW